MQNKWSQAEIIDVIGNEMWNIFNNVTLITYKENNETFMRWTISIEAMPFRYSKESAVVAMKKL